jgi:hypothetical protein
MPSSHKKIIKAHLFSGTGRCFQLSYLSQNISIGGEGRMELWEVCWLRVRSATPAVYLRVLVSN